jgi:two-component system sensor histidine kinase PilS (NtrC family)
MAIAEQSLADQLGAPASAPEDRPLAGETARRIQRLVGGFRLLVAVGLLGVSLLSTELPLLPTRYPEWFGTIALAYAAFAALCLILPWTSRATHDRLARLQLPVDIMAVTLLMHTGGGISSGIGGLLVVLVGAASLGLKTEQALLAAAVAALAVLGEQALAASMGLSSASAFVPAGVLGAIIFVIAATASPLARRLQESEALARQRGIDLANLAQLNDYVIQNLRESIVVVDAKDDIRLINQSAAELLGLTSREPGRAMREVSTDLYRVLRNWRQGLAGPESTLGFPSASRSARISTYFAPLEDDRDGPLLMFLEDSSLLAEKVRQTKLVALGRLSASIAHEIRNPIGALSHAGQLLQESPAIREQEQRLLNIINVNSRRVSEIVENVMQLSRRDSTRPQSILLGRWTEDFVREFSSTLELAEGQVRVTDPRDEDLQVRMDPSHLHQVCWNLCENALKYASETAGGICVDVSLGRLTGSRRPFLEVADRGPGIDAEMRERLFEPFATGRSGGTGLGLFISRELCECNRAALVFEPRDGGGSIFRIVFADPSRWGQRP